MSKYDEIMDKIVVTAEMKNRILSNIKKSDIENNSRVIRFRSYQKYLSIAACFVILLVGVVAIPKLLRTDTPEEPPVILDPINEIVEVNTIDELTEAVGFYVDDIASLPFEATEIIYTAYWGELAEVAYMNEEQTLFYRKSLGEEDNSGDYNIYESEIQIKVRNTVVTMKGNSGKYNLAVWTDSQYSYSISVTNGISKEDLINLVEQIDW